jgi:hypothetical protein
MKHQQGMELRIGEMVIMLDYPRFATFAPFKVFQIG